MYWRGNEFEIEKFKNILMVEYYRAIKCLFSDWTTTTITHITAKVPFGYSLIIRFNYLWLGQLLF
jgi:hypothetical protein